MARKLRLQFEDAIYHVINRGNYRRDVFESAGAAQAFVDILAEAVTRYGWRLHAYVIMRNHYHLAIQTPRANLVDGMHWLQSTFATKFNRLRAERGHLFQGRYQAILVENAAALGRVADYIHLNPVRSGVVTAEHIAAFRWSSLGRFIRGPRFDGLAASEWLAARGGWSDTTAGWQAYLNHLVALASNEADQAQAGFETFTKGWAIGGDAWRANLAKTHALQVVTPGISSDEAREIKEAQWSTRLGELLLKAGRTHADSLKDPKSASWKITIALQLRREVGAAVPWIAGNLNMGQPSSVRGYLSMANKTNNNRPDPI